MSSQSKTSSKNCAIILSAPKSLVISHGVSCALRQDRSLACSHTAYWRVCKVAVSRLQSLCEFLYDTHTNCSSARGVIISIVENFLTSDFHMESNLQISEKVWNATL